jgi:hypothetical protein
MTVFVPDPIPLEMPPGDPAAVDELVSDVAGAGFRLAVLRDELSGPAASAAGWLGQDAVAAAGQVVRVAGLAREVAAAVLGARSRLSAHGELLRETRRGVSRLREEQEEDRRAAWGRLQGLPAVTTAMRTGAPEAVAIVEEFEAAEAARRRRHAVLLEAVADDASATARVLADAGRSVGGSGRPGDEGRVLAYLAAELPGWGDRELLRRGTELADAMSGLLSPAERESLARDVVAYAGSAAFAGAFLAGLGEYGLREMLALFGDGDLGPDSALAHVVAGALGAAFPAGAGRDRIDAVLTATYIDPDEIGAYPDLVALGMGTVLVAGGAAGPRSETVLTWARQLLARERTQGGGLIGARAVDRAHPLHESVVAGDPMAVMAQGLVRADDRASAAALLSDRRVWDVLLSRSWDDHHAVLGQLVACAGTADGAAGEVAVRAGLEALGAGLADGDPDDWTVDRSAAAVVAPALGAAVAAHVSVATEALSRGVDGRLGTRDGDILRGLGYLTLDERAVRAVSDALHGWVLTQPVALEGTGPSSPLPTVAVPAAFVAVREYGQRLAYALHGFEQQEAAERRSRQWDATIGLAGNFVRRAGPGVAVGLVVDYAAILLDLDGTWTNGSDDGLFLHEEDAVQTALDGLAVEGGDDLGAVTAQAGTAYDRTLDALGTPKPPTSPQKDWGAPLKKAVLDVGVDQLTDVGKRALTDLTRRGGGGSIPPR